MCGSNWRAEGRDSLRLAWNEAMNCKDCVFGQRTFTTTTLQRIRICGRYPPNIPMPGPGGQGVTFQQPYVSDEGWCGEFEQQPRADDPPTGQVPLIRQ